MRMAELAVPAPEILFEEVEEEDVMVVVVYSIDDGVEGDLMHEV